VPEKECSESNLEHVLIEKVDRLFRTCSGSLGDRSVWTGAQAHHACLQLTLLLLRLRERKMPESKDSIIFRSALKTDVELALLFSQVDVWACPYRKKSSNFLGHALMPGAPSVRIQHDPKRQGLFGYATRRASGRSSRTQMQSCRGFPNRNARPLA